MGVERLLSDPVLYFAIAILRPSVLVPQVARAERAMSALVAMVTISRQPMEPASPAAGRLLVIAPQKLFPSAISAMNRVLPSLIQVARNVLRPTLTVVAELQSKKHVVIQ